jgi:hypothetical protein
VSEIEAFVYQELKYRSENNDSTKEFPVHYCWSDKYSIQGRTTGCQLGEQYSRWEADFPVMLPRGVDLPKQSCCGII